MLRVGLPGLDSLQGLGYFFLRLRVQTISGANLISYPLDTGGYYPQEQSCRCMKLTTYLHVVLSLRMPGAIAPLLQNVFMA